MAAITTLTANDLDNIPEDFTLESLAQHLTAEEITALQEGDDPVVAAQVAEADTAKQAEAEQIVQAPAEEQTNQAAEPQFIAVPDTTSAEAEVAKYDEQLLALAERYDEGALSRAEWLAQQKAIISQQNDALFQIKAAQQVTTQNYETLQQVWVSKLEDYKAQGNEALWSQEHVTGWDSALRSVTSNSAYSSLPMERVIKLAHDLYAANYSAMTGNTLPTAQGRSAAADTKQAAAPMQRRTDERPDPVLTLNGMNGDTSNAITDGTFASIDRMGILEAEEALSRLSPDQQRKYLETV